MGEPLSIKVDEKKLAEIRQRLGRFPQTLMRQKVTRDLERGLEQARVWMVSHYLSEKETTPTQLAWRSGALIRSLIVRVGPYPGGGVMGELTQDQRTKAAVYGPVQERGKTIKARAGHWLTIPLTLEARLTRPRMWRAFNAFFWRNKKTGNLFLAFRYGKRLVPIYLLRKSVTIPPRPFFEPTATEWLPRITRMVQKSVRDVLNTYGG